MATTPPGNANNGTDPTGAQGTMPPPGETATRSTLNAQVLGALAIKTLIAGTRHLLVPLAQIYARAPDGQGSVDVGTLPPTSLTPAERAALSRAAGKLIIEAGDLLTANFNPVPQGTAYVAPVAKDDGSYGEPSLAFVVSAVEGLRAVQAARQAKRDAKTEDQRVAALRPVSVQALRAVRRG